MGNVKTPLMYRIHSPVEQYFIWMRGAKLGVGPTCREPAQQRADETHDLCHAMHADYGTLPTQLTAPSPIGENS
jgi:hypothetical protein